MINLNPKPQSEVMRFIKHGPIQPMIEPTLLERLRDRLRTWSNQR